MTDEERLCGGCGRRKIACPCWAAGAGDEARHQREDFSRDQLALLDYLRTVMSHGRDPVSALTNALQVECRSDHVSVARRIGIAWRVMFGQ